MLIKPSLYVGETSRTVQERALEHWAAARAMEHEGGAPEFMFKVISAPRTALSR